MSKIIGSVTIGKLIEAHVKGDEEKFLQYANFIADAYEEEDSLSAEIIRSKLDGSYKTMPKIVVMDAKSYEKSGYDKAIAELNTPSKVIIESDWSPSLCPRCKKDFNEECEDGFYRRAIMLDRCSNCGQKLDWSGIQY